MARTREEALRLGIRICPTKHSQKRRAVWNNYYKPGRYGVTIHIFEYEDGSYEKAALLSEVKGRCWRTASAASSSSLSSAEDIRPPYVELTDLGRLVQAKIDGIGTHRHEEGVIVRNSVIMPTHVHLTIEITRELPIIQRGKNRERYHLGRIIGYVKSGTTGWYRRLLQGETVDEILAAPNWRDIYNEDGTRKDGRSSSLTTDRNNPTDRNIDTATLWDANYNDKILNTQQKYDEWNRYVDMNPFRWRMRDERPDLFVHRLHLMVEGTDYSAWGCMFLLRKPDRIQVFCHRYKMDATERYRLKDANGEWIPYTSTPEFEQQKATASWDAIRAFENYSRKEKLGHYDRDWYRRNDPDCITAVPYARTEAFRKQKTEVFAACEQGAVPVSPAISPGEKDIFYAALEAGFPCIKLQAKPITDREHPVNKDREYCSRGLLVVLGPWKIKDSNDYASRFGNADSKYAQFHNLNDMAAEMCARDVNDETLDVDPMTLAECR